MKKVWYFLLYYALIPFLGSIPFFFISLTGAPMWIYMIGVPLAVSLICFLLRKRLNFRAGCQVISLVLLIHSVIFTVMMIVTRGSTESVIMLNFCWLIFPFAPIMLITVLMNQAVIAFAAAFLTYLAEWLLCLWEIRRQESNLQDADRRESDSQDADRRESGLRKTGRQERIKILLPAACIFICLGLSTYLYLNRPAVRYSGHGFKYMNGFSSTDFTDYTVYAGNSKLVTLGHESSIIIENEEDMPVLDGAEACYPLYAAFAKAVYKDIDQIELHALKTDPGHYNGKIVTFSNTVVGFERLIRENEDTEKFGDSIDMFFGARPSRDQLQMADEFGVEVEVTPIGKEAFVFFVEEDNPVTGLTDSEIRQIYHGDITNWAALGGKNEEIVAFQRPQNSGSQTMMTYFMGDAALKEPKTYEMVDAMAGVINEVAQYANEDGAIGYTFRYFLEELNQEKGVKMLEVNGVYPTVENIENGTYPLTVDLCLVTRKDDPNPNVERMKEFILSEDGQEIIRRTGYAPL